MRRLVLAGPLLLLLVTIAQADPPGSSLRAFPHVAAADGDERFVTQREFDQRLTAIAEAVRVALAALDKRLDAMNEFRQALNDLSQRLSERLSKAESAIAQIAINTELLHKLESQMAVFNTAGSPFAIEKIEQLRRELESLRTLAESLSNGGGAIAKQSQRDIVEIKDQITVLATRIAAIEVAASTSVQLWELIAAIIGVIGIVYGIVHYGPEKEDRRKLPRT